jgi:hypothetical protein
VRGGDLALLGNVELECDFGVSVTAVGIRDVFFLYALWFDVSIGGVHVKGDGVRHQTYQYGRYPRAERASSGNRQ